MKLITLVVDKQQVYTEVDKHASYVGAKNGAYEQLRKKDADNVMLEKAWKEACEIVTSTLGEYLAKVTTDPVSSATVSWQNYAIALRVPDGYNEAVTESVKQGLFAFFAEVVLQKWFEIAGIEAQVQLANSNATLMLQDVKHKILMRERPLRPGVTTRKPEVPEVWPPVVGNADASEDGEDDEGDGEADSSGTGTGGSLPETGGNSGTVSGGTPGGTVEGLTPEIRQ